MFAARRETGVHIDDPTSALGFPAIEALAKEQSAVALLVQRAAGIQHDAELMRRTG
jgi:hypothetical protein